MLLRKKEEIEDWLNQYEIRNYEMIEDHKYGYVVNINRSVDLYNKKLKNIDVETFEYIGEECSIRNRDMRFECSCCSKVSIFKDKNGEYRTDDKDFVEKFVVK